MRRRCQAREWLASVIILLSYTICVRSLRYNTWVGSSYEPASGVQRSSRQLIAEDTVYDCNELNSTVSLSADDDISKVTFQNCPLGAISVSSNSNSSVNVTIKHCTFRNSSNALSISADANSIFPINVVIQNCSFDSNSGALSASSSTRPSINITIQDCSFSNNNANQAVSSSSISSSSAASSSSYGAALTLSGGVVAQILGCSFNNNSAQTGAAVYSTAGKHAPGSLQINDCAFHANSGHGTVYVLDGMLAGMSRTNFTANTGGSAMVLSAVSAPMDSDQQSLVISQSIFEGNSADGSSESSNSTTSEFGRSGAALRIEKNLLPIVISDCVFLSNYAARQGGAIAVTNGNFDVSLRSLLFSSNRADLYGGALAILSSSTVSVQDSFFTDNSATQGGAVLVTSMSSLEISACQFEENFADKFGGAISATAGAVISVTNTTFLRNQAAYAGALECWNCDSLSASSNNFLSNYANGSAGAMGLYASSSPLSLLDNVFRSNKAAGNVSIFSAEDCSRTAVGAGGAVCASITVNMNVRNNTFDGNQATSGGALFLTRQCGIQADDSSCTTAKVNLYGDNTLSNNIAFGGAGGAVYALNASHVSISCNGSDTSYTGSALASWPYGANGCQEWYGNTATAGGYGAGLATGLAGLREVNGSGSSRFNVSSNSMLVVILTLYDFLGTAITKGTYEATGTTVAVWLSGNLTTYLSAGYSTTSDNGIANFSSLQIRAPPDTYNLSFFALPTGVSDRTLYNWAKISVEVRSCRLGEVTQPTGDLCTECSGPYFYSFSTANTTCDSCPSNAACSFNGSRSIRSSNTSDTFDDGLGFLVPDDGYWHSSPFSPQMLSCPYTDACKYDDRNSTLGQFQESNLSVGDTSLPTPNTSVLYNISTYWQLQCATGYTGRLCAQCQSPEYGWRSSGRCYKCPPRALNTLFYCLSYLLTIVLLAWTVRASLGRSLGESRALVQAARNNGRLRPRRDERIDDVDDGTVGDGRDTGVSFKIRDTAYEGSASVRRDASGKIPSRQGTFNGFSTANNGVGGGGSRTSGSGGGSRRCITFSDNGAQGDGTERGSGGGSQRGSAGRKGGIAKRSSRSTTFSGDGPGDVSTGSRKSGAIPGVLELAVAAAMAELEAKAARRKVSSGGGGRDDDGDDDTFTYGSHFCSSGGSDGDGDGDGYGYSGGGGLFGGRLSGGAFAGAVVVVDSREGSVERLLPAVLPGMRPNIRSRVPRSVRARESRLAQSSAVGGDGNPALRLSEGSDGSDGEQAAARRHRLARMSRATYQSGGSGAAAAADGSGRSGGSSDIGRSGSGRGRVTSAPSASRPFAGPVSEGLTTWFDGVRRRRAGDASTEGGGGGGGAAADGEPRGNSDGGNGRLMGRLGTLQKHKAHLNVQLKEDELYREEKPPHAVVLKILVNFLQVTTVARKLNLDYPDFIKKLWNVGCMASSAMTTLVSIDCSFPGNRISKAIQRTIVYIAVPWVFIFMALPLWILLYGLHLRRHRRAIPEGSAAAPMAAETAVASKRFTRASGGEKGTTDHAGLGTAQKLSCTSGRLDLSRSSQPGGDGGNGGDGGGGGGVHEFVREGAASATAQGGRVMFHAYIVTRMVVTILAVIFYFYPAVTDAILSIYQCSRLDKVTGPYAGYLQSVGYYWEQDYGLHCFHGSHLVLTLAVAAPGLVLWCIGVPLGSALWLRHNAERGRLNEAQFSDRYGFLYEDYRRTTYFWESVIMARKLLVVGLLLATNSSEDIMQVLTVLGVVVVAAILHLYIKPYEQERFNRLETISLTATLLILYLCCFFLLNDLTATAKQVVSVIILIVNVAVLTWFVYCLVMEAYRYGVRVLDSDGDGRVSREEVREWLNLTLGSPLSGVVAFIAAPRSQRLRGHGGVAARPGKEEAAGMAVDAMAPPTPPLVVLDQTSPPASPPPLFVPSLEAGSPSRLQPPPPPPPLSWLSRQTPDAPVKKVPPPPPPLALPPPSPPQQPQPGPPSQVLTIQMSNPLNESYTTVMDMRISQDLSPADFVSPSPHSGVGLAATAVTATNGCIDFYSFNGSSAPSTSEVLANPPPGSRETALGTLLSAVGPATSAMSGAGGADRASEVEVGGRQNRRTSSARGERAAIPPATSTPAVSTAALLSAPGSLPGSPLEGAQEPEGVIKNGASPLASASAASGGGSGRILRPNSSSRSGDGGGGGGSGYLRTRASLEQGLRPLAATSGSGGGDGSTAAAAATTAAVARAVGQLL